MRLFRTNENIKVYLSMLYFIIYNRMNTLLHSSKQTPIIRTLTNYKSFVVEAKEFIFYDLNLKFKIVCMCNFVMSVCNWYCDVLNSVQFDTIELLRRYAGLTWGASFCPFILWGCFLMKNLLHDRPWVIGSVQIDIMRVTDSLIQVSFYRIN